MSNLEKLHNTKTLKGFARLLGYKPKSLAFILYKLPPESKYTTFEIAKSSGGKRTIHAPIPQLKLLQKILSKLLQDCFEEAYGTNKYGSALSHGFRRGHSILTNANKHKNKRYVFNIDLKDFFPSLNFGRVRGFFIASNDFKLHPDIATIIAQIACHENKLPQGSPVSPVISNLIGHILDIRLVRLAKSAGCTYSRYADDITFSTRAREFPKRIAIKSTADKWSPSKEVNDRIERSGFEINNSKVSMQYDTNRQMTTGLVVNKKVNIKASYYRQARAMCDSLFRTGKYYLDIEKMPSQGGDKQPEVETEFHRLRGILTYIYNVKSAGDDREISEKWAKPTAIHTLFRRFVYFEKFHSIDKPLVICEGKTDNIYLKCALQSLASKYTSLVDTAGEEIRWKIDFLKHSRRNMDLIQFSGGTGDFPRFIDQYNRLMNRYICSGQLHPVILLIDMDQGAKGVFSSIEKLTKERPNGTKDFYHLTQNLYVVVVPPPVGKAVAEIEGLFNSTTLEKKLEGKSFHRDKDSFNSKLHYSKQVFAEAIVKAHQAEIDFNGFRPLLDRMEAVTNNHMSIANNNS